MTLNGILDAAVMGGIQKYKEAFFKGNYLKKYSKDKKLVNNLYDALNKQISIHSTQCYSNYPNGDGILIQP